MPPNISLPKHWHPGEEFAYVLEGSVTLWQKGKDDIVGKAGDVVKIPLKQVHTAITTDQGATLLVFRVHEQGEPERIPVEDD
jgi:quercetin dioxygenase-like cupin family protein